MNAAETPGRRLRVGFARATLAALAAAAMLAGLCVWLAFRAPRWWPAEPVAAAGPDRGAAFEQAIVAEFTRVRPSDAAWAVRIEEADVNAWLTDRLPKWLESRELPVPGAVRISFEPGVCRLGVRKGSLVAWLSLAPLARGDGLSLEWVWSGVGSLPVPVLPLRLPADLESGLGRPIPLPDGRRVRVLDVEALPGEVRLRLRTEPR